MKNSLKISKTPYELVLLAQLTKEMREVVFSNTKFLPPTMDQFTPNTPGTLCHLIQDALTFPSDCVPELFYVSEVVPILNIIVQQFRSSSTQIAGRKPYQGKLS